ncbi:MAG: TetR/AcrR family transcriptional regulator [Sphaerotilus sp.]|nr:TetR/AcrR family transcriptional regulator [Sphaerotilus sp.]
MPRSARNLPADERRAVTVEAVIALAGKQNPSDITTAAIAQQMGLTQGALFRHFPNKDAILLAVMEWVAERLLGRVDKAIEAAPSPIAALEAAFMAHIDFVVKHPGVPRILFGELQREEVSPAKLVVRRLIRDYSSRLKRLVEDGKARGELASDLDADAAATLFIGSIQGLVMQSLIAGSVKAIRTHAPSVFAVYRRGIRSA